MNFKLFHLFWHNLHHNQNGWSTGEDGKWKYMLKLMYYEATKHTQPQLYVVVNIIFQQLHLLLCKLHFKKNNSNPIILLLNVIINIKYWPFSPESNLLVKDCISKYGNTGWWLVWNNILNSVIANRNTQVDTIKLNLW